MNNFYYDKSTGYYLNKGEEKLIKYIRPDLFICSSLSKKTKLDNEYSINFIQNNLHEFINSYLNGGFSRLGFLLYPLLKNISKENNSKVVNILKFVKIKSPSKINSLLPDLLDGWDLMNKPGKIKKITIKSKKINYNDYIDKEFIKPKIQLDNFIQKNLKSDLIDFYIHGSFATKDYIKSFSDLDTLLILKKAAFKKNNVNKIRNLLFKSRKFLYKIDPLQHHGHMIISEYDLPYYCQTYFPLTLFNYSRSLIKDNKLTFSVRNSMVENIEKLFWFVNYFRNINASSRKVGIYDLKFFLHAVTLFPTLYLQGKGIHIYKKQSFKKAKKDFSKDLWRPIDTVTDIRRNWILPKKHSILKIITWNPTLAYQINAKYWDMAKNIVKDNKISLAELKKQMLMLSEAAWAKISSKIA